MSRRDRQSLRGHRRAGGHPLHDRVHGCEHDQRFFAAGKARKPGQRRDALRQYPAVGRDAIIGLAVPGGKLQHRQVGCKKFQCPRQLVHARAIPADNGQADGRRFGPGRQRARQVGNNKALCSFRDIGQRQDASWRQELRGRLGWFLHASPSDARKALMRSNSSLV